MFTAEQQLKDKVAEAISAVLVKERKTEPSALRLNGEVVIETEPPKYLQIAVLLREYICVDENWRTCGIMFELVDRSIKDLNLEMEATLKDPDPEPDVGEYLEYINAIRKDLIKWAKNEVE